MKAVLAALFASHREDVDEVIAAGIAALIALIVFQAWEMWRGTAFNAATFSVAACGLIAAIGGSRRWRDGPPPPPPGGT